LARADTNYLSVVVAPFIADYFYLYLKALLS